jgi:hypothetical protein
MIFALLLFSGCAKEIVYRDVPTYINVPIACEAPEVHCNFDKETDTEVVISLRTCIEDLRKNIEICRGE